MSEVKNIQDVKKVVMAMDDLRKNDLLCQLIEVVFDDFFGDDADRVDAMVEQIENISGIENLCLFL
jgi:hypothetical protein